MEKGLVREAVLTGIGKGWSGFLWMMKIVVPVSFATDLLAWSGLIRKMDFLVQPVMDLLSLPSAAAVPLLIGMLTNIYGGMAAMVVLPFTREQMTLMAIFLLIAHNMIQEGIVQAKSGIHPVKATLVRLIAAVVTVLGVAPFIIDKSTVASTAVQDVAHVAFLDQILHWGMTIISLGIKIFLIIMAIMILLEILKATGWIHKLVRAMSPLLRVMGLNRELGFLWLTAVVFGLAYGGAVIIEESKAGHLKQEDLEMLHASVGINHSMVEDPALFLSLGLSPFWLWVPRLITAVVATRLFTFWEIMKRRMRSKKGVSDRKS